MAHRQLLTESQRLSFHAPASDERGMVRHYTLSAEDLALINRRRGDPNRPSFAVMLCYLRSAPVADPDRDGSTDHLGNGRAIFVEPMSAIDPIRKSRRSGASPFFGRANALALAAEEGVVI
jgi:hypothetical protein